jgi:hypothetical protein
MTTLINDDTSSSPVGHAAILWSTVGLLLFIFAAQRSPLSSVSAEGRPVTLLICDVPVTSVSAA